MVYLKKNDNQSTSNAGSQLLLLNKIYMLLQCLLRLLLWFHQKVSLLLCLRHHVFHLICQTIEICIYSSKAEFIATKITKIEKKFVFRTKTLKKLVKYFASVIKYFYFNRNKTRFTSINLNDQPSKRKKHTKLWAIILWYYFAVCCYIEEHGCTVIQQNI